MGHPHNKVRRWEFKIDFDVVAKRAVEPLRRFFKGDDEEGLPFTDTPSAIVAAVMEKAAKDAEYLQAIKSGHDTSVRVARIASLFDVAVFEEALAQSAESDENSPNAKLIQTRVKEIESGDRSSLLLVQKARSATDGNPTSEDSFANYRIRLLDTATEPVDDDLS